MTLTFIIVTFFIVAVYSIDTIVAVFSIDTIVIIIIIIDYRHRYG